MSWAASFWLVLGPAYQGVSITTEGTTRVSATFIETNGLHVIWVPIVPVLLSGIALMAVRRTSPGQTGRRLLLWTISVVFLGFCALGFLSFGLLYLPVALMLIIAAVADLGRSRGARARRWPGLKRKMSVTNTAHPIHPREHLSDIVEELGIT